MQRRESTYWARVSDDSGKGRHKRQDPLLTIAQQPSPSTKLEPHLSSGEILHPSAPPLSVSVSTLFGPYQMTLFLCAALRRQGSMVETNDVSSSIASV